MSLKILYNLWQVKRSASPTRQFKRELQRELFAQINSTSISLYRQVWFQWSMVGVVSLIIVVSFGTGAYAYNSSEVTEDSPLYPVKQALEKVEEVTKVTPEAKAEFLIKKIARREAEKQIMQKRGQAIQKTEARIEEMTAQLQRTDEILQKLENKNQSKNKNLHSQVQQILEKRLENRRQQLENKKEQIKTRLEKLGDKKIKLEKKFNSQINPVQKQKIRNDNK